MTLNRLILYLHEFIELRIRELLDGNRSSVCERLWCFALQALMCRAAVSADVRELGSVMGTLHKSVIRGFGQVLLYGDTTVGCGRV
jgi:hypothetical protein